MNKPERKKKPWPTKDAMSQVYELNLWGTNNSDFYSGEGSYDPSIVNPYLDVLISFLKSFKTPLSVTDLGCGDFNIGKELVKYASHYMAVDIVEGLIVRNKKHFKIENLEFQCLDITKDELPFGECAIVRQVLQHLSNDEVDNVVKKLADFKYVILTEHIPEENFIPNKDIISGQGIRLKKKSGLNLLAQPFNFQVMEENQLLATQLKDNKGLVVTTLYTVF